MYKTNCACFFRNTAMPISSDAIAKNRHRTTVCPDGIARSITIVLIHETK